MPAEPIDPDVELLNHSLERLFRLNASRKLHSRRAALAGVAVSQPGAVLLRRIVDTGPVSLGELSQATEMDPAATSRQIRALEEDGLVERVTSPDDRRVSLVSATRDGRDANDRMAAVLNQHLVDVLDQWSTADRRQLAALLARMVDEMALVNLRAVDEPTSSPAR